MCKRTRLWYTMMCESGHSRVHTGTYSTKKGAHAHEQHLHVHNTTLWSAFELASKEHKNSQVCLFVHVCCADIHIHGVHMLLSIQMAFRLLSPSITDDIHHESTFLAISWSTSGIKLTGKYNKCVHVVLNCLLVWSLFIFNSSTMGCLCSLESVWMVFEF